MGRKDKNRHTFCEQIAHISRISHFQSAKLRRRKNKSRNLSSKRALENDGQAKEKK